MKTGSKHKIININRRLIVVILMIIMAFSVSGVVSKDMVSAKTTSVKQLRKDLKYAKEQLKIAKQKLSSAEQGTKTIFMGKVISSSPLVVQANILDNSYYWITNPSAVSSDAYYLGSFNGFVRKTGGYRNYNNITCAEAVWVNIPDKLYRDVKKWKKKVSKLKQPFDDRIYISPGNSCYVGETIKLKYTWLHSGKYNKLKWKSGNKKIATVDSKGVVTAKGAGTTYIYATATLSKVTKRCKVKVKKRIENITFAQNAFVGVPGDNIELGITKYPSDAAEDYYIDWESSIPSIKRKVIDIEYGQLYINRDYKQIDICGNYTIVVTSESGKKWTANLTIPEPEIEVELSYYLGDQYDTLFSNKIVRYYLDFENHNIDINKELFQEIWKDYRNVMCADEAKEVIFNVLNWKEGKTVTYSIDNTEIAEITNITEGYNKNKQYENRIQIKGKAPGVCNLIVSSADKEKYRLPICIGNKPKENETVEELLY